MEYRAYDYQKHATEHIIDNSYCGLFLEMGLGKTVATLTALKELMLLDIGKVLVIAPLRVAEYTWPEEIKKWNHLKDLNFSTVIGDEAKRKKALRKKADIYIINRENVCWLVGYYGSAFPFDTIVIDELSSFKSAKSHRFKALRQVRPYAKRVIGLTGTPAPNSLMDLWSQVYLLDRGERLERTITAYRRKYFTPGQTRGHVVFNYNAKQESEREIHNRISDICMSMKAKDYLDMPDRIDNKIDIVFGDKLAKQYKEFEKSKVLEFLEKEKEDGCISAVNAASLTNKLLQFCNGAVYDELKQVKETHNLKLEALEELVECNAGKSMLVFYNYKHDLERILKKLKKYDCRKLEKSKDIEEWNTGNIQILLAHPASCGHGLNLQAGGNIIVWYGLNWSLELYQQANARLYRQGQKNNVIIHHLVARGTMDENVMAALARKKEGQEALLEAVKAKIAEYRRII